MFLLLFSYFLLCDLGYRKEEQLRNVFSLLLNSSNLTLPANKYKYNRIYNLSLIEYLLSLWIMSFMLVEIRQFLGSKNEATTSRFEIVVAYFRDGW